MSNSTVMRNGLALIISFVLLFVLTSCRNGNQVIGDLDSEKVDILELDETAVVNAMNFDHYVVSLIHNTNEEVPINRTVDVYGVLLTENDCDTVKSALTNRFSAINLYSNGKKNIPLMPSLSKMALYSLYTSLLIAFHILMKLITLKKLNLHTHQA